MNNSSLKSPPRTCPLCGGTGKSIYEVKDDTHVILTYEYPCPECKGREVIEYSHLCGGSDFTFEKG